MTSHKSSLILCIFCSFVLKNCASSSDLEFTTDVRYGEAVSKAQYSKTVATEDKNKAELADFTLESVTVFAFARPDLIKYHLESIDHDVKQVFVVLNKFSIEVTFQMREILKLFDCRYSNRLPHTSTQTEKFRCLNPFIKQIILLESDSNNVGFAGSFNMIAKKMLQGNVSYTIISNDDTRFRPGSLLNIAILFEAKPHVCLYLFSHFSSFGIRASTLKRIGVMDEHFWPAYSEDIDYFFRSILQGCHIFLASSQDEKLFVSHGESLSIPAASATLKSSKDYRKLIENTKHIQYGRDAYLCKKWGGCAKNGRDFLNSNKVFKALFRRIHKDHEILHFGGANFSSFGEKLFNFPFNRANFHVSWWDNDERTQMSIRSPRLINMQNAPSEFVWKLQDQKAFLETLEI